MTDDLRTRIAAVIYDSFDDYAKKLLVKPHLPGAADIEGDGKPFCYRVADALIAAGVTMPAPQRCNRPLGDPGRFCRFDAGHEGDCW